jgi:hypothetical protein
MKTISFRIPTPGDAKPSIKKVGSIAKDVGSTAVGLVVLPAGLVIGTVAAAFAVGTVTVDGLAEKLKRKQKPMASEKTDHHPV